MFDIDAQRKAVTPQMQAMWQAADTHVRDGRYLINVGIYEDAIRRMFDKIISPELVKWANEGKQHFSGMLPIIVLAHHPDNMTDMCSTAIHRETMAVDDAIKTLEHLEKNPKRNFQEVLLQSPVALGMNSVAVDIACHALDRNMDTLREGASKELSAFYTLIREVDLLIITVCCPTPDKIGFRHMYAGTIHPETITPDLTTIPSTENILP